MMSSAVVPSTIDLNLLLLLAELLDTPSPTVVAQRLGRTQSAVSHGLAQLRELLGDPLFVRVGRGLVPTPRALALVEPVEAWKRATTRIVAKAEPADPARLRRTFRLSAADGGEHLALPGLMSRLREAAPHVSVEVTHRGNEVEDALQRGSLDVLVGYGVRAVDGLVSQKLAEDQFVVASTSRTAPSLEAYTAAPHILVAPRSSPGGVVDTALEREGLRRFVALRTPTFSAALAAVRGPLLLTLPRRFAEYLPSGAKVFLHRPPLELPRLELRMVFATSTRDDPTQRWFRGLLRESVEERTKTGRVSS
jgi:DNA-binding transcriptional LysR family regulator